MMTAALTIPDEPLPELPPQYRVNIELPTEIRLEMLMFSHEEHRWIYHYDYRSEERAGAGPQPRAPKLINELRLVVNYKNGVLADKIVLVWHVIVPHRLGQELYLGMDLSPGAKNYLEFTYHREGNDFRLRVAELGARKRQELTDEAAALVRPVDCPFPLPDTVPLFQGRWRFPVRKSSGDIVEIAVQPNILKGG